MMASYNLSRIWKDLKVSSPVIFNIFLSKIGFSVGNGHDVSFWKDRSLGSITLSSEFPILFCIALFHNDIVR